MEIWMEPLWRFWVDVVGVQSTLLLWIAFSFYLTLRSSSASVKHRVLTAFLVGLWVLPGVYGWIPSWQPDWFQAGVMEERSGDFVETQAPLQWTVNPRADERRVTDRAQAPTGVEAEQEAFPGVGPPVVIGIWLLGMVFLLSRFLYGHYIAYQLRRASTPISDPSLEKAVQNLLSRFDSASVEVRIHPGEIVPLSMGLFRPLVLLPCSASDWTRQHLEVVLSHELGHVQRNDLLTQALARMAVIFFWCQPLAWWLEKSMRIQSEKACDDAVLGLGTRPSAYARHLLVQAKQVRRTIPLEVGASMIRRNDLEERILAILNRHLKRNGLSSRAWIGLMALAALAVFVTATLQPAAAQASPQEEQEEVSSQETEREELKRRAPAPPRAPHPPEAPTAPRLSHPPEPGVAPLPPLPPLPPAPPAPEFWDGGTHEVILQDGGRGGVLEIRLKKVELSEDRRGLREIRPGGYLLLETRGESEKKLALRKDESGVLEQSFLVEGESLDPESQEAKEFLNHAFQRLHEAHEEARAEFEREHEEFRSRHRRMQRDFEEQRRRIEAEHREMREMAHRMERERRLSNPEHLQRQIEEMQRHIEMMQQELERLRQLKEEQDAAEE